MNEDNSFSVGVFPEGKPEKTHVDAEYLTEKGFETEDNIRFSKELEPGKLLIYDLSSCDILVKKGDDEPILIAGYSPAIHYIEGLYKTLAGVNL